MENKKSIKREKTDMLRSIGKQSGESVESVNEHFLGILHILGIFKSAPNIMHNMFP